METHENRSDLAKFAMSEESMVSDKTDIRKIAAVNKLKVAGVLLINNIVVLLLVVMLYYLLYQ